VLLIWLWHECGRSDRVIEWMRKTIPIPSGMAFDSLANQRDSLTIPAGTFLSYTIKGTSDVAIADRGHTGGQTTITGTHILFELKQELRPRWINQAIVETVLANVLSKHPSGCSTYKLEASMGLLLA
jgi:hypothetical protein